MAAMILAQNENYVFIRLVDSVTAVNDGTWFPVGDYGKGHIYTKYAAVTAVTYVTLNGWDEDLDPTTTSHGNELIGTVTASGLTYVTETSLFVKARVAGGTTTAAVSVYGLFRKS